MDDLIAAAHCCAHNRTAGRHAVIGAGIATDIAMQFAGNHFEKSKAACLGTRDLTLQFDAEFFAFRHMPSACPGDRAKPCRTKDMPPARDPKDARAANFSGGRSNETGGSDALPPCPVIPLLWRNHLLDKSVLRGRYAERSHATVGLGYQDTTYSSGLI